MPAWPLPTTNYRRPPDGWNGTEAEWPARMVFKFSDEELVAVANALNEVLHGSYAIEDWEFQTRVGVTRDAAKRLLQRLRHLE